jgi:hypothetical protein
MLGSISKTPLYSWMAKWLMRRVSSLAPRECTARRARSRDTAWRLPRGSSCLARSKRRCASSYCPFLNAVTPASGSRVLRLRLRQWNAILSEEIEMLGTGQGAQQNGKQREKEECRDANMSNRHGRPQLSPRALTVLRAKKCWKLEVSESLPCLVVAVEAGFRRGLGAGLHVGRGFVRSEPTRPESVGELVEILFTGRILA